jgi:Cu2+-exporting ATPase
MGTGPSAKKVSPDSATAGCRHCGTPLLDATMRDTGFCCAGCSYVHRLVHDHGLAGYYNLKDDITAPVDPVVFQPRDYGWLEAAQREAEKSAGVPELTLSLQGISCAGCVWLIERLFQKRPGAREIMVNAQFGQMRLNWIKGEFSLADFARRLQAFNYLVGPADTEAAEPESRGLIRRIGLATAFAMNVMLFTLPVYFGMESTFEYARLFGHLSMAFGTLSLLTGGGYFINRAVQGLRIGLLHIDLPISVGIVGAYLGSVYGWLTHNEAFVYFDFVSGFILLMLLGRWAQVAAVERNRRRLLAQQPRPALLRMVEPNGDTREVAPEQLPSGATYLVSSGQTVPVESQLLAASATFSLASINGEAEPRLFAAGQRIPAGAIQVGHVAVSLRATQPWADSLLAKLLRPVEPGNYRHRFLERIIQGYLIGIFGVATFAGLGWWFGTGDLQLTWSVVTAVLVVSCPCAIGLAFPLAEEMASVALRRRGVFVRRSDFWARLARVRQIVFDKTGTLTLETPVLSNPESLANLDTPARAALHALVIGNSHPFSQCLLENLLARGAPPPLLGEVQETVGQGIELGAWSLGRAGWRDEEPGDGATVLARDGEVMARFHFRDALRTDAEPELAALTGRGLSLHILSGDQPEKVARLARELHLNADQCHGGCSPQDKAGWFEQNDRQDTLMLGDGANDSLAFDHAFCRGTPVIHRGVLESKADFYYLGRGLGGIRALFEINAVRRRTQIWILVFSVAYNLTAVGLAVSGHINPLVAAILMPVNSLLTLALVTGGMRQAFVRQALSLRH